MIYSEMVKKAVNIMFDAHKEDYDQSGYPYVFHPFYLATQLNDEKEVCVALLHDVVEDHPDKYSFECFKNEGFSDDVIEALKLLTHEKGVSYMDYVKEIGKNTIARHVKMQDLKHNLDSSRMGGKPFYKDDLYREALKYLEDLEK